MQVDEADAARAAQYQAWAERMRTKRAAAKASITADQAARSGAPGAPTASAGPTYWSTDALFAESRRVGEQEAPGRPDPTAVAELLAVLDLRDGADADQLTAAYRRLAKAHHPDRFLGADEATRTFHEERMLEVNRAYRHLRDLHGDR